MSIEFSSHSKIYFHFYFSINYSFDIEQSFYRQLYNSNGSRHVDIIAGITIIVFFSFQFFERFLNEIAYIIKKKEHVCASMPSFFYISKIFHYDNREKICNICQKHTCYINIEEKKIICSEIIIIFRIIIFDIFEENNIMIVEIS